MNFFEKLQNSRFSVPRSVIIEESRTNILEKQYDERVVLKTKFRIT